MFTTVVIVMAWLAFVVAFLFVWHRVLGATGKRTTWELEGAEMDSPVRVEVLDQR